LVLKKFSYKKIPSKLNFFIRKLIFPPLHTLNLVFGMPSLGGLEGMLRVEP